MIETLTRHSGVLIGSAWREGEGETITLRNPANEEVIAEIATATPAQVDAATAAARRELDQGAWGRMGPAERSTKLHAVADAFEARRAEFESLLVTEVGCPVKLVGPVQLQGAIDTMRYYAELAATGPLGGYERGLPPHGSPQMAGSLLRQEPAGVVAAITAYNFPLVLLARKLGAALAAGCTVVVMPSPRAPLSTIAFLEMALEAGLPPGAVNLVVGQADAGVRLTESPDVDVISFTGSHTVGQSVMRQAAAGLKRVTLELGGKSPNIVLPGADLSAAVPATIMRFCIMSGQSCACTSRILVPRTHYDEFVELAQDMLSSLTVGDPTSPDTDLGPLIVAEQRDFVTGHVERALAVGAVVEASSPSPSGPGFYVDAQLIGNIKNDAPIAQTELFGPVSALIPFDDIDDAVRIANDSPFGLTANVWGATSAAMHVARRLRSGTVTINGGGGMRPDAPWGGFGLSGIGRESGEAGFLEYLEVKHIQWPLDGAPAKPFGLK